MSPEKLSPDELMRRLQAGEGDEKENLNAFILSIEKLVYHVTKSIDTDHATREDIANESLMRIAKYWRSYDPSYKLSNWVAIITSRTGKNVLRAIQHKITQTHEKSDEIIDGTNDVYAEDPLANAQESEFHAEFRKALAEIGKRKHPKLMEAFTATVLEHEPAAQVGERLHMTISAIHMAKIRIFEALRKKMLKFEPQPEQQRAL